MCHRLPGRSQGSQPYSSELSSDQARGAQGQRSVHTHSLLRSILTHTGLAVILDSRALAILSRDMVGMLYDVGDWDISTRNAVYGRYYVYVRSLSAAAVQLCAVAAQLCFALRQFNSASCYGSSTLLRGNK
jgi:hypothetical protein